MEKWQVEQIANEVARRLPHDEAQWHVAKDAFIEGYKTAEYKFQQHMQILEMQLQQAQSRIMLLEAKMETMR